jgi:hypothetical protein
MPQLEIYKCTCEVCQSNTDNKSQIDHQRINLLMSRLGEQERRWLAAVEAERIGHGGTKLVAQITGLNINTIRRGRKEMKANLENRPTDRQRLPGGGRKPVEKKRPM